MTDTYGPATTFITQLRQWQYANDDEQAMDQKATRLRLSLVNVSFVGPNTLAGLLQSAGTITTPSGPVPYSDGVVLSQVVPNYESDQSTLVLAYQKAIAASGQTPDLHVAGGLRGGQRLRRWAHSRTRGPSPRRR